MRDVSPAYFSIVVHNHPGRWIGRCGHIAWSSCSPDLNHVDFFIRSHLKSLVYETATVGSVVVQSGRPIFDDFFQHLWPYIGNNTANVVFQMVKRLWLIRIDQ
ncbi:hypothetical protein TNCV_1487981 [Trichonephila clavipes]|nr:hypothetical protein TNCV_1487981 [Trichonephila clavipes]